MNAADIERLCSHVEQHGNRSKPEAEPVGGLGATIDVPDSALALFTAFMRIGKLDLPYGLEIACEGPRLQPTIDRQARKITFVPELQIRYVSRLIRYTASLQRIHVDDDWHNFTLILHRMPDFTFKLV